MERFRYTKKETDELIKNIVILVDTREKENSHITSYFDAKGVEYKVCALDYGDYSFMIKANEGLGISRDMWFDKDVIVERKNSLEEISGNLTKDRSRFEKELSLAPKEKVILIEGASYEDVANGNYNTKYNRISFLATLHKYWFKYSAPFFMLKDKRYSGLFIRKFFEYYLKNNLR